MSIIWDKIIEFLPFFVIVSIALIVGLITATIKIHSYYLKVNHAITLVPIHDTEIKQLNKNELLMQDIKESIRKIEEYIMRNDPNSIDKLIRKCSPYQLTSFGDALCLNAGGVKCIDTHLDFFTSEIQKMNPLVALDVENYALDVLKDNIKKDFFNEIKDFVFASPSNIQLEDANKNTTDIKVKLDDILFVMSIYLRDKYFETHPEINIDGFFK